MSFAIGRLLREREMARRRALPLNHLPMKRATLEHSTVTLMAHDELACDWPCTLHARTDHAMRAFPQHWRGDKGIMERICPCGIGHPDPDDLRIRSGVDPGNHGCCGCCRA